MKIQGKNILIAGSSSGLGAACAERLMQRGASLVLVDRVPRENFSFGSGKYVMCEADITQEEPLKAAISRGEKEFGPLSAAIICAGILHSERTLGKSGPGSLTAFQRVIHVNLIGTFNVVRLCAESIAKRTPDEDDGQRGAIIMTSSIAAFDGQIGQAAYAASKGGVASMTLPLAREFGKQGIRVVSIAPGVFETPMMSVAPEHIRQSLLDSTPFPKRFGDPEEFASLVEHILENPMFNGCTLRLDGGLRMPER